MKKNHGVVRAFAMLTQIGFSMMAPIFLCVFIGYKINQWTGQVIWFLLLLVLGIMAAFRNVYLLTKHFYTKDKSEEEKQFDYIEQMKKEGRENLKKHGSGKE